MTFRLALTNFGATPLLFGGAAPMIKGGLAVGRSHHRTSDGIADVQWELRELSPVGYHPVDPESSAETFGLHPAYEKRILL
jgi:hypothetical protein